MDKPELSSHLFGRALQLLTDVTRRIPPTHLSAFAPTLTSFSNPSTHRCISCTKRENELCMCEQVEMPPAAG